MTYKEVEIPADIDDEAREYRGQQLEAVAEFDESIMEKMVEGKVRKFLAEVSLTSQAFIKDPDITVGKLLDDKMEIILVTSGAISQGMKLMGLSERPRDTKKLQSLAAVVQQKLMLLYEKIFSLHNHYTAQVLITHNDINDRVKYLIIKGTLEELLGNDIIPIINENRKNYLFAHKANLCLWEKK